MVDRVTHQRQQYITLATAEIRSLQDEVQKDPFPIAEVSSLINNLTHYQAKIAACDEKIMEIAPAEDVQNVIKQSVSDDAKLASSINKFSAQLSEAQFHRQVAHNSTPSTPQPNSSGSVTKHVKLPQLHIKKFSGDTLVYQEFWDSFKKTIHDNNDLTEIDKFKYLKHFLEGDAFRLVSGYSLTADNYKIVLDVLEKRYYNKQLLVFNLVESMVSLPDVPHKDFPKLQESFDEFEKCVRSLEGLGLKEDTFGQIFIPIFLKKLPESVRINIYREISLQQIDLPKFRDLLRREIQALEMGRRIFTTRSSQQNNQPSQPQKFWQKKSNNGKFNNSSTGAMLLNNSRRVQGKSNRAGASSKQKGKPTIWCRFCQGSHYTDQCTEFVTMYERRKQARKLGRCFICLRNNHQSGECENKKPCYYCRADDHNRALCPDKFGQKQAESQVLVAEEPPSESDVDQSSESESEEEYDDNREESQESVMTAALIPKSLQMVTLGQHAILQTAITHVKNPGSNSQIKCRSLFDNGCQRTCILDRKCKELKLKPVRRESISVSGFRDRKRKTLSAPVVEFDYVFPDGQCKHITANVVKHICCPVQKFPLDAKQNTVLTKVPLAEPLGSKLEMVNVDILLGSDYYYDIVHSERIECSGGLVLLNSSFGFIAAGTVPDKHFPKEPTVLLNLMTNEYLERFWSLEHIGINDPVGLNEDEEAIKNFKQTVEFENGRYSVALPWKSSEPELDSNYMLALGCLKSQISRFKDQTDILQKYDDVIKEQEKLEIIEKAPKKPEGSVVHYLPHHGIIKSQRTTTKLRIVYNASAKSRKTSLSLNECLYRGPVLLEDLAGMIFRFRLPKIAMTSDIEKAFLQVCLRNGDRDAARFLWVKDLTKPIDGSNLIEYRFSRVFFGCVSSPFLLGATIQHHMARNKHVTAAAEIEQNVYVDNVIGGRNDTDGAFEFYREAKQLFNDAGMNLREWYSNDTQFVAQLSPSDVGQGSETKMLGLRWNVESDSLRCSGTIKVSDMLPTKKQILSVIHTIFDPCGWFSPVILKGKILHQKICKLKTKWDDPVPFEMMDEFRKVAENCGKIETAAVPRIVCSAVLQTVTLHCFCDASEEAYAACVYMVTPAESCLLFAKTRVSPIKQKLTIPRLELIAAFIGSNILQFVEKQLRLPIIEKYLWSDNQCVLTWLTKQELMTPFVQRRVDKIRSKPGVTFKYVPTTDNPADVASRGSTFEELQSNHLWWNGPSWLTDKSLWPKWTPPRKKVEDEENVGSEHFETIVVCSQQESVIDIAKFKSFRHLTRVTARILRLAKKRSERPHGTYLSTHELQEAENRLIGMVQKDNFGESFNKPNKSTRNTIDQLGIFRGKDGLLRCKGRFEHSDLSDEQKYPILLPEKSPFTVLIIKSSHENALHAGVNHTLSQVRRKYWVLHGKRAVKHVLHRCELCKRVEGKPFAYPKAPPLPDFRVSRDRPFSRTGIDHLGPLLIRTPDGEKKVWILLFTCAVVRAVHLEVVDNMTTNHVVMALQRFVSLYGMPSLIISDNASNYKASENFLQSVFKEAKLRGKMLGLDLDTVQWRFITEKAPWMGGFYERMVGIVKRTLRKVLQKRKLSLTELQTICAEVSASVNTRPLTQSDECVDLVLTPAHFLRIGGPVIGFPSLSDRHESVDPDYEDGKTADRLVLSYKRTQKLLDEFWEIWNTQYLASLREQKSSVRQRNASQTIPVVGSVVLLKENLPRSQWKLAKIVEIHQSSDKAVRSVTVEVASGKKLKRPVNLLYPLEITAEVAEKQSKPLEDRKKPTQTVKLTSENSVERPLRAKALIAKQKIQEILDFEGSDSANEE